MLVRNFVYCIALVLMASPSSSHLDEPKSYSRFDYEYKVLQKLVDLENANREQNQRIAELTKKNSDLETEIKDVKNVSSEYKEANMELEAALEVERNAIQSLTSRVENLSSSSNYNDQRSFYGFSAYESTSSTVPKGSTIVLRHTRLNEGGCYNIGTGHFTAPVDGIYIFHATLCIKPDSKFIFVAFMAEEEVVGRFASNDKDYNSCHSGSALARLQKGNRVFLRVTVVSSGPTLFDDYKHMNSFAGFLVGF